MIRIPIIDLSHRDAATDIDTACRTVGFFGIVGHGVPADLIQETWRASRRLFDLPQADKTAIGRPTDDHPYGYAPPASETLSRSRGDAAPPDLKETFSIGPAIFRDPASALDDESWALAANHWPSGPQPWAASFRETLTAYYTAMGDLSARLTEAFARGLGLDESFFAPFIDRHISALRLLNYPDQAIPPAPGQLRAGAHCDYGSLTILLQDDAPGGLEVWSRDGRWVPAPPIADGFMVNVGDLMERWTNDRWVSTLHRVVNPAPDATGSTRRQSIAFFHQPNWDAEIACLASCLAPGERPKYPPVSSGEHLKSKFRASIAESAEHQPAG